MAASEALNRSRYDVTCQVAKEDPTTPIFGMPLLEAWKAGTACSPGARWHRAGIDNTMFYRDNTTMLSGDAKEMTRRL